MVLLEFGNHCLCMCTVFVTDPDLCLPVLQVPIKASGWVECGMATACVRAFPMAWPLLSAHLCAHLWPPCAPSRATAQCSRTSPPPQTHRQAAVAASFLTSTQTARSSPARRRACSAGGRSSAASGSCASLTLGPQSPASAALRAVMPQ